MYGEYWYISQPRNGKVYYFVGIENRDRRVWTTSFKDAATFRDKDSAVKYWEKYANCEGRVTGWTGAVRRVLIPATHERDKT